MKTNKEIDFIRLLQKGDRLAQKELYDTYSAKFFGLAMRYAGSKEEAEDILQDAFLKIFQNVKKFRFEGSFEGWMRRIIVNTAIIHYHKTKKEKFHKDFEEIKETDIDNIFVENEQEFTMDELLAVIQSLPPGYRTVFNLYAIEGYKHKEIAEMLKIDENTSKSQYHRARKLLQKKLNELKKKKYGNEHR